MRDIPNFDTGTSWIFGSGIGSSISFVRSSVLLSSSFLIFFEFTEGVEGVDGPRVLQNLIKVSTDETDYINFIFFI